MHTITFNTLIQLIGVYWSKKLINNKIGYKLISNYEFQYVIDVATKIIVIFSICYS